MVNNINQKAIEASKDGLQQQLDKESENKKAIEDEITLITAKITAIKEDITNEERVKKIANLGYKLKTIDTKKLSGLTNKQLELLDELISVIGIEQNNS